MKNNYFYVFSKLFVVNDMKTNIIKKRSYKLWGKRQDSKINNCNEVNGKDIKKKENNKKMLTGFRSLLFGAN